MTEILGTIRVTGELTPTRYEDIYAIADALYMRGGYRSVADSSTRNLITMDRRSLGMMVRTNDTGKLWVLINNPATPATTDPDWEEFQGGVGSEIIINQTGHSFNVLDVVRAVGVNQFVLAQADTPDNADMAGVVSRIIDADNFVLMIDGEIYSNNVPNYSGGTCMFLSPTVAGAMTNVEPTALGEVSMPVGYILEPQVRMLVTHSRGSVVIPAASYSGYSGYSGGGGSGTGYSGYSGISGASAAGRLLSFQRFTAGTSGTYTTPSGVNSILVEMVGGGGGGGGANNGGANNAMIGGAGGGGGYTRTWIATANASYNYLVGVGGNGGPNTGAAGSAGTASTWDAGGTSNASAGGGGLGAANSVANALVTKDGGTGGAAAQTTLDTADLVVGGQGGRMGIISNKFQCLAGDGGSSFWGSGGGGGAAANNTSAAGNNGSGNGGGGGGAAYAHNTTTAVAGAVGGSGTGGLIIVWEYD